MEQIMPRILVVDDNHALKIQEAWKKNQTETAFVESTSFASSFDEAKKCLLRNGAPDIAVLDWDLGGDKMDFLKTGISLAVAILASNPDAKILCISDSRNMKEQITNFYDLLVNHKEFRTLFEGLSSFSKASSSSSIEKRIYTVQDPKNPSVIAMEISSVFKKNGVSNDANNAGKPANDTGNHARRPGNHGTLINGHKNNLH